MDGLKERVGKLSTNLSAAESTASSAKSIASKAEATANQAKNDTAVLMQDLTNTNMVIQKKFGTYQVDIKEVQGKVDNIEASVKGIQLGLKRTEPSEKNKPTLQSTSSNEIIPVQTPALKTTPPSAKLTTGSSTNIKSAKGKSSIGTNGGRFPSLDGRQSSIQSDSSSRKHKLNGSTASDSGKSSIGTNGTARPPHKKHKKRRKPHE